MLAGGPSLKDFGLGERGVPRTWVFVSAPGFGCCDMMGQGVIPRLGKALIGGEVP